MRGAILLPQYVFMAWCLVEHRDNFTFTPPNWRSTPYRVSVTAYSINSQVPPYLEAVSSIRSSRTLHAAARVVELDMRCHCQNLHLYTILRYPLQ
jgi:hypothetical protein